MKAALSSTTMKASLVIEGCDEVIANIIAERQAEQDKVVQKVIRYYGTPKYWFGRFLVKKSETITKEEAVRRLASTHDCCSSMYSLAWNYESCNSLYRDQYNRVRKIRRLAREAIKLHGDDASIVVTAEDYHEFS